MSSKETPPRISQQCGHPELIEAEGFKWIDSFPVGLPTYLSIT